MGVVFFLTLTPILLVILATAFIMALVGIAVLVVGVGGSIVSATAIDNKGIKRASLCFFISLLLLGLSCVAVLCGIFMSIDFFIVPSLIIIGMIVVGLGIYAIVKAVAIEQKAAKITLIVLLSLSALIGAIVFAIGVLMLVVS